MTASQYVTVTLIVSCRLPTRIVDCLHVFPYHMHGDNFTHSSGSNKENDIKVNRETREQAKTTWFTVRERIRKGGKNGDSSSSPQLGLLNRNHIFKFSG